MSLPKTFARRRFKPATRTIVVKTLLNPDEFLDFNSECVAADVSNSKALRDLANGWTNDRRKPTQKERPEYGPNMAMLLPGKTNYGAATMRMRC